MILNMFLKITFLIIEASICLSPAIPKSLLEKEGRKEAVSYVSPNEEVGDGRNGSQRASVFPGFALT